MGAPPPPRQGFCQQCNGSATSWVHLCPGGGNTRLLAHCAFTATGLHCTWLLGGGASGDPQLVATVLREGRSQGSWERRGPQAPSKSPSSTAARSG